MKRLWADVSRFFMLLCLLGAVSYQSFSQPLPQIYAVTNNGGQLNGGTVLRFFGAEAKENFGVSLVRPLHRNVLGPDGYLYNFGHVGNSGNGGLFRIKPDGTGYQQLHDFYDEDGFSNGTLVIGPDEVLYGATVAGGLYRSGVIYRINGDGTRYKKLIDLPYGAAYDRHQGTLTLGGDGQLYGMHEHGSVGRGSIYKLATDGTGLTEIFKLNAQQLMNGIALHWGSDGRLYGIAQVNLASRFVLFRLDTDGSHYQELHTFDELPAAALYEAPDGLLYGTVGQAENSGTGYLYRCAMDGSSY
jgi:hypothetical protein